MVKKKGISGKSLSSTTEIKVRFSEVDAMQIVWHGNYIKYFEDGRDDFGSRYDLDFVKVYDAHGYMTPLVKVDCDYKKSLKLGDKAVIETTLVDCDAAKIIFRYKIFRKSDMELVTEGETVQVFLKNGELQITVPDFYSAWKDKWLP